MLLNECRRRNHGFTLMEILMVILLIGILVTLSSGSLTGSVNEARYQETVQKIRQIKIALIGDPEIKENGKRTSFGFLGDIGMPPNANDADGITQMVTNSGGYSSYSLDSVTRIAAGWNGPYLNPGFSGEDYTKDGWGNPIQLEADVDPITITSYGADGIADGAGGGLTGLNKDITVSIPRANVLPEVKGFVCENGGPTATIVDVQINYSDGNGTIYQELKPVEPDGSFRFERVPWGVRSISVYDPGALDPSVPVTGPNLIVIDRPNYVVPCSAVDIAN